MRRPLDVNEPVGEVGSSRGAEPIGAGRERMGDSIVCMWYDGIGCKVDKGRLTIDASRYYYRQAWTEKGNEPNNTVYVTG